MLLQCRSRATCRSTRVHSRVTRKPHACDTLATRVRHPRYSRVNIRAYASAIRVTRVCARVTSARSTRERVSIASIPRPLPPRKKVEGLGTRLACPLRVNLVHTFERERVRFRVLACTRAGTRVCVCEYSRATRARHARAVKLLVSGTVHGYYRYNGNPSQRLIPRSNSRDKVASDSGCYHRYGIPLHTVCQALSEAHWTNQHTTHTCT